MLRTGTMHTFSKSAVFIFSIASVAVFNSSAFSAEEANAKPAIKIEIIGETSSDKDSADVLAALHKLLTGVEHENFEQIGACLSPDVVMTDDRKQELVYGKDKVLEKIKGNLTGSKQKSPVKRMVLQHPFVNVKGDTAMVSFQAQKELADGSKFDSLCSEIYERKNGEWLVLKFRSNWKPAK